jgi:hypothetical protein
VSRGQRIKWLRKNIFCMPSEVTRTFPEKSDKRVNSECMDKWASGFLQARYSSLVIHIQFTYMQRFQQNRTCIFSRSELGHTETPHLLSLQFVLSTVSQIKLIVYVFHPRICSYGVPSSLPCAQLVVHSLVSITLIMLRMRIMSKSQKT